MVKKINYFKESMKLHKKLNGKLEVNLKTNIKNKNDLSIVYSPGVSQPCIEIKKNPKIANKLVSIKKTVAVISNGTSVLGLGDIGALASLPVMEGKSCLFKRFANIDSIPIVVDTKNIDEFVNIVSKIGNTFGGINLEDISAPECFEIEKKLKKNLNIPVFHDDQHGTAIVVLAGLINSLKVTKKKIGEVSILINGVGAAGTSILKLLSEYGFKNIRCLDSKNGICEKRKDLNFEKKKLLKLLKNKNKCGSLKELIKGVDIFIGISKNDILKKEMVKTMNKDPIIFALANPIPEIMPDVAKKAGAKIIATGRSDFPNQINNVLVFPAIFKACFDKNIPQILEKHKIQAAISLSKCVKKPNVNKIIPSPFQKGIVETIVKGIKK